VAAPCVVSDTDHDGVIGAASELISQPAQTLEAGAVAAAEGLWPVLPVPHAL
tara:strand:- start:117 stop:272 length:156 start_codon:yes stop_codon:yes gene_type:complete